ncbi:MAG: methyltransferase domain-containing protein [Magnetococcales bacterium]|nr:methyltransferase domain-containing protein [Magnetococcales bacterium]MBF0150717.1 methyltransferase domain-containing protein [Magnetococcales bacterium]
MFDFEKVIQWIACPHCKGTLILVDTPQSRRYSCTSCRQDDPIIDDIPRFLKVDDPLLAQAKVHWEDSPHFQYETDQSLYSKEYYEAQDVWRQEEVDTFCMDEYRFERLKGLVTLDIGSGSGWVVKQAAKHGAFSFGVDFTEKAAISTREALRTYGLSNGMAIQADAQYLPFQTGVLDRVTSTGVLHHIPDTEKGIAEAWRVIKPGGSAFISLYGKLFFFNPILFPLATFFLRLLLKAPAKRDGIEHTEDYETFDCYMDGPTNPIGRFYTYDELRQLFSRFRIERMSRSHFPFRFLYLGPIHLHKVMPRFLYRFIDRNLGMMVNVQLSRP